MIMNWTKCRDMVAHDMVKWRKLAKIRDKNREGLFIAQRKHRLSLLKWMRENEDGKSRIFWMVNCSQA